MVFILATYYESICAIISYYLVESFRDPLPWSYCREEWGPNCIDSAPRMTPVSDGMSPRDMGNFSQADDVLKSSSELFFM